MEIDRFNSQQLRLNDQVRIHEQQDGRTPAEKAGSRISRDSVEISESAQKLYRAYLQLSLQPVEFLGRTYTAAKIERALAESEIEVTDTQNVTEKIMAKLREKNEAREEKIERVKARLDSGYYDSPEVFQKIARGLIREMNETRMV